MERQDHLGRLYELLDEYRQSVGGYRHLRDCHGRMDWPRRGVYFFFELGEVREDGRTLRIVRVGTHALSARSTTTLWNRLSQHRGARGGSFPGGGNHRGSIFRLHVGKALLSARPNDFGAAAGTWGKGNTASRVIREGELQLEREVSRYIGAMPFLWIAVDNDRDPISERHLIEANTIALLSNTVGPPIDPPSPNWLGRRADQPAIRESGLWNVSFAYASYDPVGLEILRRRIEQCDPRVARSAN